MDAHKNVHKYPSQAEDSGTSERYAKHFIQHVLNHACMELEATQAASIVLGIGSSGGSDAIEYHSGWDFLNLAIAVIKDRKEHKDVKNSVHRSFWSGNKFTDVEDDTDGSVDLTEDESISDCTSETCTIDEDSDDSSLDEDSDDSSLDENSDDISLDEEDKVDAQDVGDNECQAACESNTRCEVLSDLVVDSRPYGNDREGGSAVYFNNAGVPVPLSVAHHYAYRDPALNNFNAHEFCRVFAVRKMNIKDREWMRHWAASFVQNVYREHNLRILKRQWEQVYVCCNVFLLRKKDIKDREWTRKWAAYVIQKGFQAHIWRIKFVRKKEERVARGRPCERFKLFWPHPLHDSHIIVKRAKWGIPAYVGAPPPKEPAVCATKMTEKDKLAARNFARFHVANFIPWGIRKPPTLTYNHWREHLAMLRIMARFGSEDDLRAENYKDENDYYSLFLLEAN